MTCKNCGTENGQDVRFCANCGAALVDVTPSDKTQETTAEPAAAAEEPTARPEAVKVPAKKPAAPAAAPAKERTKAGITAAGKLILGIAAGVVVLALLITLIVSLAGGDKYPKTKDYLLPIEQEGETFFVAGSKLLKDSLDCYYGGYDTSFDGTKMAIIDSDGVLYYVTAKSVTKVAEDVYRYVFSAEGDTIAYVDNDSTLYLYRCGNKKTAKIADDVCKRADAVSVSPDGRSVLFIKEDGDDEVLYVYQKNGKISEVGKNLIGIALSDNGKFIYSYSEGNLYVSHAGKDEKEKIASDVGSHSILLNQDHTEIIFESNDKMYISKSGKEKQRINISSSSLSMVLPNMVSYHYSSVITAATKTYPVDHLLDNVFSDENHGVYYINKKGESDKIASNAYSLTLSDDGKTLYYRKGAEALKSVPVKNSSKVTDIADDVRTYVVSPDEKTVYYIDNDGDLWSRKGKSSPKKIAGDVENMIVTQKGLLLFADNGNTLYSCANGKDKKKAADDVQPMQLTAGPKSAYYVTTENDLYASNGNAKFKKILEGIR